MGSLREPQGSKHSSAIPTVRFSVDTTYATQTRMGWSSVEKSDPTNGKPQRQDSASTDEGYETDSPRGSRRSRTWSSMLSLQGTGNSELKQRLREKSTDHQLTRYRMSIFHSPSDDPESTADSKPFVRRWLSTSKIPDSTSSMETFSGSSKKFWSVRLSRLSTRGSILKPEQASSDGSRVRSPHARNRSEHVKPRQRIVLASVDTREAPPIIKAAQAGSRSKVEAMLDNGENIETCHLPTKRTALAVACHCGNTAMVEFLINRAAKLNTRDIDLSTPLHLAASRGHLGAVELLLNEPVGIESRDSRKRTPLWLAAEGGHIEVVELLLKKGARIKTRAKDQLTPLHAAARGGYAETVELLLRSDSHIESRDVHFNTPLHYACDHGHLPVVDLLVRKGADIESIGKDSRLPLTFAAASGHLEIVDLLSKKKASLQGTDDKERNALHYAAANGHVEVAEFLLEHKVSIHAIDAGGLTPLHQAVIRSHLDTVEFLLKKKAKLEVRCRAGRTPLHYACDSDIADIVRLLLSAGANSEAEIRGDNRRPIHVAAARGSVETIGVLYQHGVAMDARDSAGHRPLSVACHHGHADVVKTFLSLRQSLTMPFKDGPHHDSPLCVAVKAGHIEVVQLLIRRGAFVNQMDEHGHAPLYYAAYHGHPEVLNVLIYAGAELLNEGENDDGLSPTRDSIGFAKDVSEEQKHKVRELLLIAETKTSSRANSRMSSRTGSVMSLRKEKAKDEGLIASLATPQQSLPTQLPENKITIIYTSEKQVSDDLSPKSPTSIFSAQSLRSKSSLVSLFSTRSQSQQPTSPTKSSPPTRALPLPPPGRKPPPLPPAPPVSKFKSVSFASQNHMPTLVKDGPGPKLQISQRASSLRPARSVLLPGGFTRDNSPQRMSHIGDLMVGERQVQELGSTEVYEIGREEVYEMA